MFNMQNISSGNIQHATSKESACAKRNYVRKYNEEKERKINRYVRIFPESRK